MMIKAGTVGETDSLTITCFLSTYFCKFMEVYLPLVSSPILTIWIPKYLHTSFNILSPGTLQTL